MAAQKDLMIFIIDSNKVTRESLKRAARKAGQNAETFDNGFSAMQAISGGKIPEMIFLDIFLTGPDGFSLLNELASYPDTMDIPITIVSEKDFSGYDLKDYGVKKVLSKYTMRPEDIINIIEQVRGENKKELIRSFEATNNRKQSLKVVNNTEYSLKVANSVKQNSKAISNTEQTQNGY